MKNKLNRLTKIGILFLGIIILFNNCDKDENPELTFEPSLETNPQTVSFNEAKNFFIEKQKQLTFLNKTSKSSKTNSEPDLELNPNWNSFSQDSIFYSSSLLIKANVEVNRSGNYSSYLYFVKKNDQIKNVIFTIFKSEVDADGNAIEAYVFFNDLDGTFLDAYKIEDGVFRKKLVPKQGTNIQKASFFMLLQSDPTQLNNVDFWCNNGTGGQLEEVVVTAHLPYTGSHTSENYDPRTDNFFGPTNSGSGSNDPTSNGGGMSERDIASGGGALLLNPITLSSNEECPNGYVKDSNGSCIKKMEDDEDKPNPESFCFKTKGLWQEAATTGVKFWINLVTISPNGIKTEYKHLVNFPQPILFGMPANLRIGNIDISNEVAAEVTANAVNNVMRETSRKFAFQEVSTMTVEQYFRSELTRQFALHIPGGRVQFNAMNFSGVPCIFKHL